jgi:tetratricopeptide (TPR) repeat protein
MRFPIRGVVLLLLGASLLNAQEPASCETGLARFRSGDFAAAQDSLWECMESGSGNETHALYLALTYRPLRNYESGLTRTQKALKTFPDNLDLLYIAAYLHYRRNETKDSMILASKAYRLAPNDWRIHQLFALNYISFDMLEAAKLSLQRAISLNPKNAELHYQLARLYFTLGSFVDSIEESKQALALSPDYAEAYHNLALSYEGNGNVDAALQNFEKAVELNRKDKRSDEWPFIDFATYQRMGGKPDAALPLLEEALAINPRSSKANYEMGELLRDLKKYQDAKKFLQASFDLDPCNARALYGLALVTRLTGDTPGSLRLMKQFKELEAANKEGEAANRKCQTAR